VTARAHVESDFIFDGVRLMVATRTDTGRLVRTWDPITTPVFVQQGVNADDEPAPGRRSYVQLTNDEARAIYQALAEYFGTQVSDNRLLRADYEAERRRVDKFIDASISRSERAEQPS
jgi:hypothetical protein